MRPRRGVFFVPVRWIGTVIRITEGIGYYHGFKKHPEAPWRGEKENRMPTSTARVPKRNKRELEKYRRLLEQKKAELSTELAKARSAEEETNEEATQDIADKAVSSYTREFLYSLTDGERTVLRRIDEALARIDEGTYGSCMNCGASLSEKRLNAVPWAPHCVDCQELAEKGLLGG
jgi:DnaK suppressor protein